MSLPISFALCLHKWRIYTLPVIVLDISIFFVLLICHNRYYLMCFTDEDLRLRKFK